MPTYEYRCANCGEHTEAFQKMSDAPLVKCPKCGHEALKRLVSGGAGVIYKGEGWYVTDYSKKASGGKDRDQSKPADKDSSTPAAKDNSTPSGPTTASGDTPVPTTGT